jgi:tRNA-dihydrouridine synthase B
MTNLQKALQIIEKTVKAAQVPVTLKMRSGWDQASRNAPELARAAEAAGVAMVTVHGRTRCQFYRGEADWRFIGEVKAAVAIPVVANGDVTGYAAAAAIREQSGADGVMIGRACYGRPWLPGQIAAFLATGERQPEPDLATRRDLALEHFDGMIDHHGPVMGVRCFRKHFGWYSAELDEGAGWRGLVNRLDCPRAARTAGADAFDAAGERQAA